MTDHRDIPPTIWAARYAKRQVLIKCPSVDGFKTRAARLAEALKGRYTNRERGYIMSEAKAEKLMRLYLDGWDATIMTGELIAPESQ